MGLVRGLIYLADCCIVVDIEKHIVLMKMVKKCARLHDGARRRMRCQHSGSTAYFCLDAHLALLFLRNRARCSSSIAVPPQQSYALNTTEQTSCSLGHVDAGACGLSTVREQLGGGARMSILRCAPAMAGVRGSNRLCGRTSNERLRCRHKQTRHRREQLQKHMRKVFISARCCWFGPDGARKS